MEKTMGKSPFPWWYPGGAQLDAGGAQLDAGGAHFRIWAPARKNISAVFATSEHPLKKDSAGFFSGFVPTALAGDRYAFRVDGQGPFPDPTSRFQPDGPHGFSQLVDPTAFQWTDQQWKGNKIEGQVIYEMHIGTFTAEGTWAAAIGKLEALANIGITLLEVMPVNDFAGNFGWGYDGVDLFAPSRIYGTPDDFREFINQAHALKMGVILDVVYNHIGPDGNFLSQFSQDYFTTSHKTDWGPAINFYGENSGPVRDFFVSNAAYWIAEFHLDGLRLDATQNIYDKSAEHILAAMSRAAHKAAFGRDILLVAENEPQEVQLIRPQSEGGFGLDALWNDDFHHSAAVAATGKRGAYYTDYLGSSQELLSSVKYGFLYQGQWYGWQKQRRGTPLFGTKPARMIVFLQNHDQIANSARGYRLDKLTSPGILKALTALLLLAPSTPMLFQGQEFAASTPFLFFADHKLEIAKMVRKGRAEFLSQWRDLGAGEIAYDDPSKSETFLKCKLDWSERETHQEWLVLHKDLLQLRRTEEVFSRQDRNFDGAVLSPEAFVLRFFSPDYTEDRLLVVNLGRDLLLNPSPEPLLGPPPDKRWNILWSSEAVKYLGNGTAPVDSELNWIIPAQCALVLLPLPLSSEEVAARS
jgi:maltooligosyltrehalose trehalohydrolase